MTLRITIISLLPVSLLLGNIAPGYGQQGAAKPVFARAAGRFSGTVTDGATGQPVAYASVAVLTATGTPVNGGVGGENGQFVLPGVLPGTYTLRVSALGYQDFSRPGIVVPEGGPVALGLLPLIAATQKLGEVLVTASPLLVEEKVDRTVYHAENDQTTRGGDAIDVLRRVPLLSVDLDGNVSVRGNQSIKTGCGNCPPTRLRQSKLLLRPRPNTMPRARAASSTSSPKPIPCVAAS